MSKATKPHLNLVVVGHVDHGKSTTVGHLMYLRGLVEPRKMDELRKESAKTGLGETFAYAWLLDVVKEERERGVTIDSMYVRFETDKLYYTIIDCPGHRDFVKNMLTGTSQADAAFLVVSAKKGEFETGIAPEGQTTEHAFLLFTMGIRQIVVGVNKMDDATVDWSKDRYSEVKNAVADLMTKIGFNLQKDKISFVPISGWTGDNLVEKSKNMPWYDGPTLIQALDTFTQPTKPLDKPLRIPIQQVFSMTGVGTVPVGRVETGVLKVNDNIIILPSNKTGTVASIEMHHERMERAEPGDNIGFNVKGIAREEIKRGDVLGPVNAPPTVVKEFVGQIIVIRHPTAVAAGYTPVLHVHTETVATEFAELLQKIDPRTGAVVEEKPSYLKTGDAALVRLKPTRPIAAEAFKEFPPLGRFAIRDMGMTIAAGVIREITQKA